VGSGLKSSVVDVTTTPSRRPKTRERILEAAFDVIAEEGLSGFTMTEVERRVGLAVGTGSIYRHFPSKEALLKAAVEREVSRNRTVTHEARSAVQQLPDPLERRTKVYKQMLDDLRRFDRVFGLMLSQGDRVPELREAIRAAVQPNPTDIVDEGQGLHAIAMAALGGYHLFSIMQGHPFNGVEEDEFVEMLAQMKHPDNRKSESATKKQGRRAAS
jgi:AcrR family transcriptional regulator